MKYDKELESIQADFRAKVEALADKVRTDLMIPVCRRHQLEFYSGNGTFFFDWEELQLSSLHTGLDTPEGRAIKRFRLQSILEVLDLEVSHNNHLGFYCRDVRKGRDV